MFMGFERHEGDVNERLVYDTIPVQQLTGREQTRVAECFQQLLTEEQEQRFCSGNLIVYLTMQLHSLYCRYAFEHRQKQREALDVWQIIVKVLLENYGYTVVDLGKDVDPAAVAEAVVAAR